jgi:hypothetical protein
MRLAWTWVLLPMTSYVAGVTTACHHTWLIDWDGIPLTFSLGWPWTVVLPISVFQLAEIIGVSYNIWPRILNFSSMIQDSFDTVPIYNFCLLVADFPFDTFSMQWDPLRQFFSQWGVLGVGGNAGGGSASLAGPSSCTISHWYGGEGVCTIHVPRAHSPLMKFQTSCSHTTCWSRVIDRIKQRVKVCFCLYVWLVGWLVDWLIG